MNTRKLNTKNVFVENDCFCFDSTRAEKLVPKLPKLGALCLICSETELPRDLGIMDNACAENAIPLLFENVTLSNRYKLWLFTAHCPWQPKSVMVKHQKLWKGLSRKWDLSTLRLYDEVMSESEEGIRFAGVGEVAQDGFLTSILLMREEPSSFLILSERDNISAEMKSSLTLTSLFFLLIRNQNLQLIG